MSSPVNCVDNLSPSLFYQYDALEEDADSLPRAEASMNETEKALQKVQRDLAHITKEVDRNRSSCKEQVDRIRLVSTHWFYGSTALQPQLWFRGGCQGKIARAEQKLQQAEDEYPNLARVQEQLRTQHVPPLEARLAERTAVFERCAAAVSKRASMKEDAVTQYPSPKLCQLREQSNSLQQHLVRVQQQFKQIKQAKTCQSNVVSNFYSVERSLREADQLHQRCMARQAEVLQASSEAARSITTAAANNTQPRRCGTPGCGFAVSAWHPTHCCNACKRGKPFPHNHGKHCERKAFPDAEAQSRQAREKDFSDREQLQRNMERDNRECQAKLTTAQEFADRAVDQSRQAVVILQIVANNGLLGSYAPSNISSSLAPLGCAFNTNRETIIKHAQHDLRQHQSEADVLGKHISNLESKLQEERDSLDRRQVQTAQDLAVEKSEIFDKLRIQVMTNDIQPSAPPGPW